jgi:hypothetical protein
MKKSKDRGNEIWGVDSAMRVGSGSPGQALYDLPFSPYSRNKVECQHVSHYAFDL